jgi:hypothetical protein
MYGNMQPTDSLFTLSLHAIQGVSVVFRTAMSYSEPIGGVYMGIFDSFKELIGNKISDIAPEELVNKAGELLNGEQVSEQAQQAVDSVTEAAGVDNLTDQASDLAQQGTELGQEAMDQGAEALQGAADQGTEAVQQVTEQANEATGSLTEKAQGLLSNFTDKWK